MAVIWRKQVLDGAHKTLYEVRRHGHSRRLYTDGVFHSQYNPNCPVSGSVWDLLLLPAFFHSMGSLQRVLVLGVGGGAVIKQLQYFIRPSLIVGVEINPIHLQVARQFFSVKGNDIALIRADAIEWVKHYRGPAFDLIIDDLFFEQDGQPGRAVDVNRSWAEMLLQSLSPSGSIVTNFDTPQAMHDSYWLSRRNMAGEQLYQFTTPLYLNSVLLLTRQATSRSQFQQNLRCFKELDGRRSSCKLNFSLADLSLNS